MPPPTAKASSGPRRCHRQHDQPAGLDLQLHPTAADAPLLVEVVGSSLTWDRVPKLALYTRHGVPEVWIVDLAGRAVEVCREPGPEGYAERRRVTEGIATPTLVPGVAIDVAALLAWPSTDAGRPETGELRCVSPNFAKLWCRTPTGLSPMCQPARPGLLLAHSMPFQRTPRTFYVQSRNVFVNTVELI